MLVWLQLPQNDIDAVPIYFNVYNTQIGNNTGPHGTILRQVGAPMGPEARARYLLINLLGSFGHLDKF